MMTCGYIAIRWNQHNSHGVKPTTSDKAMEPSAAIRERMKKCEARLSDICLVIQVRDGKENINSASATTKTIFETNVPRFKAWMTKEDSVIRLFNYTLVVVETCVAAPLVGVVVASPAGRAQFVFAAKSANGTSPDNLSPLANIQVG